MTNKMVPSIIISLFAIVIGVIMVYFIGCQIEESFWVKGMKQAEWQSLYLREVCVTGLLVELCSLGWIIRTYTMPSVTEDGGDVFPRPLWIGLFVLAMIFSVGAPFFCTVLSVLPHLHVFNILLSFVLFVVIHYFVTVFCTPNIFKYAPIGAGVLRG